MLFILSKIHLDSMYEHFRVCSLTTRGGRHVYSVGLHLFMCNSTCMDFEPSCVLP